MASGEENLDPRVRRLVEEQLKAIDTLEEITEAEKYARVPESTFVNAVLPVLTSKTGNQSLEVWLSVAGAAQRGLAVVNNAGEVIFKVPPIFATVDKTFIGNGKDSVYEIMRTAEQKNKMLPTLGDRYLEEKMRSKIARNNNILEGVRAWNAVLKHYGYQPLINVSEKEEEKKQEDVKHDLDFFGDYDEL